MIMLIYAATDAILFSSLGYNITKVYVRFNPNPISSFLEKVVQRDRNDPRLFITSSMHCKKGGKCFLGSDGCQVFVAIIEIIHYHTWVVYSCT